MLISDSAQILTKALMVFIFFVLLWQTFLLRIGLLIPALTRFKSVIISFIIAFGFFLGARCPRFLHMDEETPYIMSTTNYALTICNILASLANYCFIIKSVFHLGSPGLYKPVFFHPEGQNVNGFAAYKKEQKYMNSKK